MPAIKAGGIVASRVPVDCVGDDLLFVTLFGILLDLAGKVAQHIDHVLVAGLFDRLIDGGFDHGDGDV